MSIALTNSWYAPYAKPRGGQSNCSFSERLRSQKLRFGGNALYILEMGFSDYKQFLTIVSPIKVLAFWDTSQKWTL